MDTKAISIKIWPDNDPRMGASLVEAMLEAAGMEEIREILCFYGDRKVYERTVYDDGEVWPIMTDGGRRAREVLIKNHLVTVEQYARQLFFESIPFLANKEVAHKKWDSMSDEEKEPYRRQAHNTFEQLGVK
jgi:hypothetical protein